MSIHIIYELKSLQSIENRISRCPKQQKCLTVWITSKNEFQADSNLSNEPRSDDEVVLESPQFKPSTSQVQVMQQMYMFYIVGPKMDWTLNDRLYHIFLKWKIRCENILDCKLPMLSEARKCKKAVAWSGDFGIDQYVLCYLLQDKLCLELIWNKFEEFCKPQTNEVRARFDLLTSF